MSGRRKRKQDEQLPEITEDISREADAPAARRARRPPSGSAQTSVPQASAQIVKKYLMTIKVGRSVSEVIANAGAMVLRVSPGCYAMPGYKVGRDGNVTVLQNDPVHIYIAPIRFTDGDACLLACDSACCDSLRLNMRNVDGTAKSLSDLINEATVFAPSKECVYVQVFKSLGKVHEFIESSAEDAAPDEMMYYKSPFGAAPIQFDDDICVIRKDPLVVSVAAEGDTEMFQRVFLTTESIPNHVDTEGDAVRYIKCMLPKCNNKYACVHAKRVNDWVEWASVDVTDEYGLKNVVLKVKGATRVLRVEPKCRESISQDKFDLAYVSKGEMVRKNGGDWIPLRDKCVPSTEGMCACGFPWNDADPIAKGWVSRSRNRSEESILYGPSCSRRVKVYYRPCTNTNATDTCKFKKYDGKADGVFNLSGDSLFLHETLRFYINCMTHIKTTMYGIYEIIKEDYARFKVDFCSYNIFQRAVQLFIPLLDVRYDEGYMCPCCSHLNVSDMAIIADGKCKGFKQSLMQSAHPDAPFPPSDPSVPCMRPIEYAYISNISSRKMLYKYAHGEVELPTNYKRLVMPPGLVEFLDYISDDNKVKFAGRRTCPSEFRQLIACISTPHPVSTFISPVLVYGSGGRVSVLEELAAGNDIDAEHAEAINAWWPSLGTAMVPHGKSAWTAIPEKARLFLEELLACARKPSVRLQGRIETPTHPDGLEGDPLEFFAGPMSTRLRRTGNYSVDKAGASAVQDGEYGPCTKRLFRNAHRLTPGLFTIVCPHGVVMGFKALRSFEGPNTLFAILYERFSHAPGLVIYDNACNAARYAISREPEFFAHTKFLIDRMHFKNHIGCHLGFNIDAYPADTKILGGRMTLGELNSQACEQVNSKLSYMGGVSFMGEATYFAYVKLFIFLLNRQKIDKVIA
jgi:hypothetical protein